MYLVKAGGLVFTVTVIHMVSMSIFTHIHLYRLAVCIKFHNSMFTLKAKCITKLIICTVNMLNVKNIFWGTNCITIGSGKAKETILICSLQTPELILDTPLSRLWYKKDTKFNIPKAYVYFRMASPFANASPIK